MPLKERIPYFVEASSNGEVKASEQVAQQFHPDEKNLRYFLGHWATNLLTIDTRTKEFLLPESYMYLRGTALTEWQEWVEVRDQPLKKLLANPAFRREARIASISFVSDGVALIRVTLVSRGNAMQQTEDRKLITVHYSFIPPANDEEIMKNPLGVNITHFTISDELA